MTIPKELRRLLRLLREAGGLVLLIGGGVIDTLMGRDVKDWDLEVYGLSLSQIEKVLEDNEFPCNLVGKSFGIIKTQTEGLDIDLSVPRRENKVGTGHRGFEVELDPTMTPTEAGRRRDLTINSMYVNVETGEIIDPFGGLEDLHNGVIRATDPETFVEDPLRVLRIMQLLPRKGETVAPETRSLCQGLHSKFSSLPAERVFEEFSKLLLKAPQPSIGLRFLVDCGWISHFPELEALIECPQNPEWHPEGDVWEHTLRVVDMAAKLKNRLPKEWRLAYMFGALLHDTGKPSTTLEDLTSPGHEGAGREPAESFMTRITAEKELISRVVALVVNHMRPGQLVQGGAKESAWKRLHNCIRLDVIGLLSRADSLSRYNVSEDYPHPPSEKAVEFFNKFGEKPIPAVLMGRHLIEAGMSPGPQFGVILRTAYEIQIEEDILDYRVLLSRVL